MMDWRHLLSAQRLGHDAADIVRPERSPFQKDWDRVVFSSAFRRLQDKTQVHSLPESDYVRTRLTHSLEVSSVGRSLGAAVGDTIVQRHLHGAGLSAAEFGHIVAAACLAHDIGNPPFGHFGENIIRHWFADATCGADLIAELPPDEKADFLGFEGNAQGFRILARLQNWRDAGGLRLTHATLATFAKYPRGSLNGPGNVPGESVDAAAAKFGFFAAERALFAEMADAVGLLARGSMERRSWCRHPLAFLVEAADDICYRVVDLEDGYKLGRVGFNEAEALLRDLVGGLPPRYGEIDDQPRRIAYLRAKAIGRLTDDVALAFLDNESVIMAGQMTCDLLSLTKAKTALAEIASLSRARIFQSRERFQTEIAGNEILAGLLSAFCGALIAREQAGNRPLSPRDAGLINLMPELPAIAIDRYRTLLAATDFISGMTDSYALNLFRRIEGMASH